MPDGASIFETTGAWEDYSTPARDFRLLIAIDVVRGFPDRFARRSDRYAMPAGKSVADVKSELQSVLASELAARKISYTRSDGSQWTLSLKDVVDRAANFEMAYNPNDCVELRWGAPESSEEASTCKRHAPQAQRAKMRRTTAAGSTSGTGRRTPKARHTLSLSVPRTRQSTTRRGILDRPLPRAMTDGQGRFGEREPTVAQ